MLRGYTSEKSVKQASTHRDYLNNLREKYTENSQLSMTYRPKINFLRDNSDSYRKRSPQVSRNNRLPLGQNKQFLNRQSRSNRPQIQYQSLLNKKTGISDGTNTFLTDKAHLKLKELNKLSVFQTNRDRKSLLSNHLARNQVNGIVQDNPNQNCQQFKQINPNIYDSPIKLLYADEKQSTEKESTQIAVLRKQEETSLIHISKSLPRKDGAILRNNQRMSNNKFQRQFNKSVISNVEKMLGQIRKTLNS